MPGPSGRGDQGIEGDWTVLAAAGQVCPEVCGMQLIGDGEPVEV